MLERSDESTGGASGTLQQCHPPNDAANAQLAICKIIREFIRTAKMKTQITDQGWSFSRIVVALLIMLPAIAMSSLEVIAVPDLETWLAGEMKGFARPDAFDGLARVAPVFTGLLGVTSLLAAWLVISHKSQYLLPLSAGPLFGLLVYLSMHGVTDPAWCILLALLAIGMLVGTPVTAIWAVANRGRHITKRPTGATVGRGIRN